MYLHITVTRALLHMCMTFAWNTPLTPRPAKIPVTTKIIAYDTNWCLTMTLQEIANWQEMISHLSWNPLIITCDLKQKPFEQCPAANAPISLAIFSKIPCYTYFVRQKEQSPYNVPKCLWDQIEWFPTFFWHISRQKYCSNNCTLNYKFLVNH